MQIYSLEIDDFSNNDYILIGLHTAIEDYKLAYLLNQQLSIKLEKANYSLDFKNKDSKASFTVFEYINTKLYHNWYLISNTYIQNAKPLQNGLFFESDIKTYLIAEKKKVDYFLKIEGDFDHEFVTKSLEKINNIKQVITSYSIEVDTLKSKEFLIF